jgi:hypothetical protein
MIFNLKVILKRKFTLNVEFQTRQADAEVLLQVYGKEDLEMFFKFFLFVTDYK